MAASHMLLSDGVLQRLHAPRHEQHARHGHEVEVLEAAEPHVVVGGRVEEVEHGVVLDVNVDADVVRVHVVRVVLLAPPASG